MLAQVDGCEQKRKLLQDLLEVLSHVSGIRGKQAGLNGAHEQAALDELIERAVSRQREALRALEDHQQEHGC